MPHTPTLQPFTDDLACRCLSCGRAFTQDTIVELSGYEYPGASKAALDLVSPCCRARYDEESYAEYMERHGLAET